MSTKTYHRAHREASAKRGNRDGHARLTITNGCFTGLTIELRKDDTTLGRDIECDICLDDSLVSSRHAVIHRSGKEHAIEDLNSRGGVTLNGKTVHRGGLKTGDLIGIGNFKLKFRQG